MPLSLKFSTSTSISIRDTVDAAAYIKHTTPSILLLQDDGRMANNVQRVHVYTKADPAGLEHSVSENVVIESKEDLDPDAVKSNKWIDLPLAAHFGIPLQFATTTVPDNNITNRFARFMSGNLNHSYPRWPEIQGLKGAIMVIRSDGGVLHGEDVEALADFVSTKLSSVVLFATVRSQLSISSQDMIEMAKQWQKYGSQEAFGTWWFEWRDRKVKDGESNNESDYASLQCPIPGAVPTAGYRAKKKAKEMAEGVAEKRCNPQ